jgi:putative phosphonate transport system ATP-binding protein
VNGLVLEVEDLTNVYGPGCDRCIECTGPESRSNACPECGSIVACAGVSFEIGAAEVLGRVGGVG